VERKPILLVEDNLDDIYLTRRALEKSRFANPLIVAQDGETALEYASGNNPPAVILLDLNLPKMDGIEVLRRIRNNERTRDLPVVIMTSSEHDQDWITGYDLGITGYIRKPVDFVGFFGALKDHGLQLAEMKEDGPPESAPR
jgi:two-component system response regulator